MRVTWAESMTAWKLSGHFIHCVSLDVMVNAEEMLLYGANLLVSAFGALTFLLVII